MHKEKTLPQRDAEAYAGTAAFQELLTKSPDLPPYYPIRDDYQEKLARLEAGLKADSDVKGYLGRLGLDPAECSQVLHVIAVKIARPNSRWGASLTADLKRRRRNIRSLAKRIRSMAAEIDRTYRDTMTHPDLVGVALQINCDVPVVPAADRIPSESISGMLAIAGDLEAKAAQFADGIEQLMDAEERRPHEELLAYLNWKTGNVRKHLGDIAGMLNAAYKKEKVSEDSLEKIFTRHVLPRLNRR